MSLSSASALRSLVGGNLTSRGGAFVVSRSSFDSLLGSRWLFAASSSSTRSLCCSHSPRLASSPVAFLNASSGRLIGGSARPVGCARPTSVLGARGFSSVPSSAGSSAAGESAAVVPGDIKGATVKLLQAVQAEIQHEKTSYEAPPQIQKFLKESGWKLEEKSNDVNMTLTKEVMGKKCTVEFQLVSPFSASEGEGSESTEGAEDEEAAGESTDFSFTVSNLNDNGGVAFYCTTLQNDEKFRFMIGNVRFFKTEAEKTSPYGYNGPEFEDLDENFQEALDEWLAAHGVDTPLCDFIDALALDKESREYTTWLANLEKFIESQ
eukprot:GHVT01000683.1.p1 GENE.GHVT01000683.1~~GHVT01000683.1.p1  ORF type:complete len:322 (+),score=68.09 GHVT01000683.1:280-1245(+)